MSDRTLRAGAALVGVMLLATTAEAQPLGGVGESCRARSDCQVGLRCWQQVCREPACHTSEECGPRHLCRNNRCIPIAGRGVAGTTPPGAGRGGAEARPGGAGGQGWADFRLGGTHLFGGLVLAPGMSGFWPYGNPVEVESAFFFAFRLGVLLNRTELALEIAPDTWVWDFDPDRSSFSFNATIGGFVEVAKNAYWPLRFGLGMTAGELPYEDVYLQGRVDLIGLAFNYGHLLFEVSLPSTRFHSELQNVGIWAWLFNLSVTYVI